MKSLALTDHGVLFGAVDFYKACLEEGIKPLIGCEVYVSPRRLDQKEGNIDTNPYHLVLLAENNDGYKNLMKVVSEGFIDGFYYKPRVCLLYTSIRIFYRTGRRIKQGVGGKGNSRNVLIVGAGEAGIKILRELAAGEMKSYVVGFVDDNVYKQKKKINGLTVLGGREDIHDIVEDEQVNEIIIALPSVPKKEMNEIAEICHKTGRPCLLYTSDVYKRQV